MSVKCDYCGLIYPLIKDLKKHFDICNLKLSLDMKLSDADYENG